jgi:CRP-like cAMP-binding protein
VFKMRVVDRSQMTRIAEKMQPVVVEKGQVVARQGDSCDVIWFVASGSLCDTLQCEVDRVEVTRPCGLEPRSQTLGPGACIGELSFVQISELVSSGTSLREARETALRTADVIACEHTELLELSFDDAWTVVQRVPNFFYSLKEVAGLRYRALQRTISPRSYSPVRSARAPTLVHDARRRDSPARGAGHVDASSEQGKQPVAQQPLSTLDEAARIRAVRVLWKLVIPPLQALCDEVQEHFNSQNVGINLVDAEEVRQHWQASSGSTPLTSVKRSYSLCSDAIADPEALAETCGVLVVMDVAKSDRYRDRVMNTGFYASTLIRYAATEGAAGHVVGTLCVHDENPRERFGAEECKKLREYGDKATAILAAPLPSWLGGNVADQPRLQSIEDRLAVLAVRVGRCR